MAQAWGQTGWADYSGVSRTLSGLSWPEAHQIAKVLEQVGQPYLEAELQLFRSHGQRIRYDGDLTGIPVSNTSRTYPKAAFGHMDDEIRLGYQAAGELRSTPSAWQARLTGDGGFPAPITRGIPFLAPRPKAWSWRRKLARDCVRSGVQNYCAAAGKPASSRYP